MKRGTNETAIGRRINPRRFSLLFNCDCDARELRFRFCPIEQIVRGRMKKREKIEIAQGEGSISVINSSKQSVEF